MALFPVLISVGIAALFLGVRLGGGKINTGRLIVAYLQMFLWWPLIVFYFNDLLASEPGRPIALPPFYHAAVTFGFALAILGVYSVAVFAPSLSIFLRRLAVGVGCWLTLNWFFLAFDLPSRAPEHDFTVALSDMRGWAAVNGIALAMAALVLARHAINPSGSANIQSAIGPEPEKTD